MFRFMPMVAMTDEPSGGTPGGQADESSNESQVSDTDGGTPESEDTNLTLADIQAENERMRKRISELNKENEKRRKSEAKLLEQEEERRRAEMSELEKLQTDYSKLQQQLEQAKAARQQTELRRRFDNAANSRNLVSREAAWKLVDITGVTFDDEGNPSGIEEALDAALKEYPFLIEADNDGPPPKPGLDSGRGKGTPSPTAEDEIDSGVHSTFDIPKY